MPPVRALALVAVLTLAACASAAPAHDDVPHRIVSLLPSLTEDLFAIGAGPLVVGVTDATDYPPEAKALPVVGGVASVDPAQTVSLHPDVVVGTEAQSAQAEEVRRAGIRTVLLKDDGFYDIFRDIESLGLLTARLDAARALNDRLRAHTLALIHTVRKHARPPSVYVALGSEPNASYIEKLIALAGGVEAAAIDGADVVVADPAVPLHVRDGHVVYLPDPALLERPGPRYNDGLAWLIATLNAARV